MALPGLPPAGQAASIQRICGALRERVLRAGLVPRDITNPHNMPWFFRFRDEILNSVKDPAIRNLTY